MSTLLDEMWLPATHSSTSGHCQEDLDTDCASPHKHFRRGSTNCDVQVQVVQLPELLRCLTTCQDFHVADTSSPSKRGVQATLSSFATPTLTVSTHLNKSDPAPSL